MCVSGMRERPSCLSDGNRISNSDNGEQRASEKDVMFYSPHSLACEMLLSLMAKRDGAAMKGEGN